MFHDIGEVLLVSLIYDTPMLLSPCHVDIAPSPATLTSNKEHNQRIGMSHLPLLATILAQWWRLVAFEKALNFLHCPLGNVRGNVPAHRHGHQFGHFFESFVECCLFFCCPGSRWGNTELVFARCQRPGASSVALDFLKRAMPRALLQRVRMAIKMARDGGVLSSHHQFCYQG